MRGHREIAPTLPGYRRRFDEAVRRRDLRQISELYRAVREIPDLAQYPPPFGRFCKNLPVLAVLALRPAPDAVQSLETVFDRETPFDSLLLRYLCARICDLPRDADGILRALRREASGSAVQGRAVLSWKLFFDLDEIRLDSSQRADGNGLPAPLIQFWDSTAIPDDVALAVAQWEAAVGQEQHILFDDRTARAFIQTNLGPFLAKYYDQCWHPAMKADYFRLCYLTVRGGIYADADCAPVTDLRNLCAAAGSKQLFVFRSDLYENRITNMFLYSPQDGGAFETCVLMAAERIRAGRRAIFEDTGPGLVTDGVLRYLADRDDFSGLRCLGFKALTRDVLKTVPAEYKKTDRNWRNAFHMAVVDAGWPDRDSL